jgi:hypothetical protein
MRWRPRSAPIDAPALSAMSNGGHGLANRGGYFTAFLWRRWGGHPSLSTRVAAVRDRMKADLTPNWTPFRNPSAAPGAMMDFDLRGLPA